MLRYLVLLGLGAMNLAGGSSMSYGAESTAGVKKKWDPTAHFRKRSTDIEKQIASLGRETSGVVVLLGDSITQANSVKELGGMPVVNQGISGDQVEHPTLKMGVRNRLHLVAQAKPKHVFLLIGINDLWGGQETAQQLTAQYEALLSELRKAVPDATIHIQSIMPAGGAHGHLQQSVDAVNTLLPKMAKQIDADFVNLDPILKGADGQIKPELTTDGIHLSPAGYEAWIAKLQETLTGQ